MGARRPAGLDSPALRQICTACAMAVLLGAGAAQGGAALAAGPVPPSPPSEPSAAAAPGSNSGKRVAHEFLYGESPECSYPVPAPDCERQPSLCVPASWQRREICEVCSGDDGCGPFFVDARTLSRGRDTDPDNGVEGATLVLYAGHGDFSSWTAINAGDVPVSDFSAGDGLARYWWMMSCNVMAHGPLVQIPGAAAGDMDYLAPERFTNDFSDSADVFATWTVTHGSGDKIRTPLNRQLRMACGGSTKIGGGSSFPTAAVWHYKLMAGLPVADAFTLGLATGYHVPLCIVRGNADRERTPLYDQDFVTDPNLAPSAFLYIQYPVHHPKADPMLRQTAAKVFNLPDAPDLAPQGEPPGDLPVLVMDATPLPPFLRNLPWQNLPVLPYGFRGGAATHLLNDAPPGTAAVLKGLVGPAFKLDDLCVKRHAGSGAVVLSWRPQGPFALGAGETDRLVLPASLIGLAGQLQLSREQWTGHGDVDGVMPLVPQDDWVTMQIDGTLEQRVRANDFKPEDISRSTKCTYVRLDARVNVGGTIVPVFGEGAQWLLAGCPRQGTANSAPGKDGDVCSRQVPPVLTISWVGRQVRQLDAPSPGVLSVAEARTQAVAKLSRIANGAAYREAGYRWGYKAAPVSCSQGRMFLVYQFDFRHLSAVVFKNEPPITVEVPGHRGFQAPSDKRIEDTWSCSPEVAAGDELKAPPELR
jgi:hypothetical protein